MAVDEEKQLELDAAARHNAAPGPTTGSTEEHLNDQEIPLSSNIKDETNPSNASTTVAPTDAATTATPPEAAKAAPVSPEANRSSLETAFIMISLCCGVFLAALDTTIITTAVPTISEHFHSDAGYTWIGSAYLLANAALTPTWGKISDIWGRKPILLLAAAVFFLGSALAGASTSIAMLIVARAIQGAGGGGLINLANICISDLFSMRNRGKYFGFIGMVWACASAIGPIVGGAFTERVSWRWCFYINLPITGAAFCLQVFYLKLHNPRTPVWDGLKAVDWIGSLCIIGGTLMFLLGLEFGGVTFPWDSAKVVCLIVFGAVAAVLFVLYEWRFARYPVMPLRIFKYRSNIAALGVCFMHGYVFIAGSYFLPLYFQAVVGASPLLSGVYLLPWALSLSFCSAATGIFIKKTGKYLPPIFFGLFMMTLGFGLFIDLDSTANWAKIIIFQIIAGIGTGPNFQSPLIALQTKVAPRDIATATATFGFTRMLSCSISVVIGGVVFQNQMIKKAATLEAALGPQLAAQLGGGSAGASTGIVDTLPEPQRSVVRFAFWDSLRIMWIMYVVFAAFGLFTAFFIGNQKLSKEHQETKTGLAAEEAHRKEQIEKRKAEREARASSKVAGVEGNKLAEAPGSGEVSGEGEGSGLEGEEEKRVVRGDDAV